MEKLASQLHENQTVGKTKHFTNQMNNWVLGPEDNGEGVTKREIGTGCWRMRRGLMGWE